MTKESIMQIFEASSNGTLRPELAAIWLTPVCEAALELFKTVAQQKARLELLQRAQPRTYVPE
tara:strand:- start:564 stop:752 length:189 start_codon:yes stop_codon:yes gene_type:complete